MKTFKMIRNKDETGVSGTGPVLEGVIFTDGKCVVHWLSKIDSIAVYDSFEEFKKIHVDSHPDNDTVFIFDDLTMEKQNESKPKKTKKKKQSD